MLHLSIMVIFDRKLFISIQLPEGKQSLQKSPCFCWQFPREFSMKGARIDTMREMQAAGLSPQNEIFGSRRA